MNFITIVDRMSEAEKPNGHFWIFNVRKLLDYQKIVIYDEGFILALLILMLYFLTVK